MSKLNQGGSNTPRTPRRSKLSTMDKTILKDTKEIISLRDDLELSDVRTTLIQNKRPFNETKYLQSKEKGERLAWKLKEKTGELNIKLNKGRR